MKNGLNDPAEGFFYDDSIYAFLDSHKKHSALVRKCYNDVIAKIQSMGIYSLSKSVSNELLWAHYASGHTGFAIEYDIDYLKKSLNFNKYLYRDLFIQAIESIKNDPNVESFYMVTVSYDEGIPLLKIFAYTIVGVPPIRAFQFRIDDNGNIYQID